MKILYLEEEKTLCSTIYCSEEVGNLAINVVFEARGTGIILRLLLMLISVVEYLHVLNIFLKSCDQKVITSGTTG